MRRLRQIGFLTAMLLPLLLALPAAAETSEDFKNPNAVLYGQDEARKVIEGCWAISYELRHSGSTAGSRYGALDTYECLQNAILDYADKMFDPSYLSRDQMREQLESLAKAHARFYWDINNENRSCDCGTQFHTRHNYAHAALLEKMLRDMLQVYLDPEFQERIEYKERIKQREQSDKKSAPQAK